jgi:hypothetical protein
VINAITVNSSVTVPIVLVVREAFDRLACTTLFAVSAVGRLDKLIVIATISSRPCESVLLAESAVAEVVDRIGVVVSAAVDTQ